MLNLIQKLVPPTLPILYIEGKINQSVLSSLIKRMQRPQLYFAKAFAIVINIQNQMPVQIDKIADQIKFIKKEFKIPIYSFCLDKCTAQSYYLASVADQIYALKSTIFELKPTQQKIQLTNLLQQYGIKKKVQKSNQKINGTFLDNYSSANTSHFINKKATNISQRLFKYAMENRLHQSKIKLQCNQKFQKMQNVFMSQKALSQGLIDNIGSYYQILFQKHPDCRLKIIKLLDQPRQVKKSIGVITSPILLLLLMFKVFLKYSIILYLYLKAKNK